MFAFLLVGCLGGAPSDDIIASNPSSPKSAGPAPQGPTIEVPTVSMINRSTRSDSHSDFVESGVRCKVEKNELSCQKYESHHSFVASDLPDKWELVADNKVARPYLNAVDLHERLNEEIKLGTPKKEAAAPDRGSSKRMSLQWKGKPVSFDLKDAPPPIQRLDSWLMSITQNLSVHRLRHQVQLGKTAIVGMKELSYLDQTHALKVAKCEARKATLQLLKNGKVTASKKLSGKSKTTTWKPAGFAFTIEAWFCGRKNHVRLIAQSKG